MRSQLARAMAHASSASRSTDLRRPASSQLEEAAYQPCLGTRIRRCRCSLPGLTGFTPNSSRGTGTAAIGAESSAFLVVKHCHSRPLRAWASSSRNAETEQRRGRMCRLR